jgi:hypothetical protein
VLPDGTEEVIREAAPKPRGGDTWLPRHYEIPEPLFRELWGGRIRDHLSLRDSEHFDDLGLDQILRRLVAGRGSRVKRDMAAACFGRVRGPRWLRQANTQELLILALGGNPTVLKAFT